MRQRQALGLPIVIRGSVAKLGADIRLARLRRRLTVAMMAERLAISAPTYLKVERGDAGVSIGTYALALFTLGLGTPLADLADASRDTRGLLLEGERLPKRVRPKMDPASL